MHEHMIEDVDEEPPSRCSTVLYYTWKICTCLFSHVLLVSMVVTYCILGAFTFRHLEATNELEVKRNITRIRNNVTADLWQLTDGPPVLHQENWTIKVVERLELFEKELVRCVKADGWDGSEDEGSVQWTLSGALFYSIIVITTIGYGHIAPKTHWGKVVTIFYAILGIPLMLLCLSNIGDIMAHSFRFLYWRVCCYVCTRRPKRASSALPPPLPPPGHFRRGRSVRNTTRSTQSGGRYSGRSRTASFKRSARTSQRSADSALGLSRSSYSDTDCRFYDETDRDLSVVSGPRVLQNPQRFSDTVLQPTTDIANLNSTDNYKGVSEFPQGFDPVSAARTPVLFNRYALDREESTRSKKGRRSQSTPRRGATVGPESSPPLPLAPIPLPPPPTPSHLDLPTPPPMQLPPSPLGSVKSRIAYSSRPRVMTPMGFAISRQSDDLYDYDTYAVESSYGSQQSASRPVPIWLCVFLVVTYIFCGAYLFHQWEGWHFLDSAYFCFITLTTIGFGDYVPAHHQKQANNAEVSIALCSLYLLFGIALLAMSFNLVQEEVIGSIKGVARRLGIIKDDDDEDAD